jgi:hypothetical protein
VTDCPGPCPQRLALIHPNSWGKSEAGEYSRRDAKASERTPPNNRVIPGAISRTAPGHIHCIRNRAGAARNSRHEFGEVVGDAMPFVNESIRLEALSRIEDLAVSKIFTLNPRDVVLKRPILHFERESQPRGSRLCGLIRPLSLW